MKLKKLALLTLACVIILSTALLVNAADEHDFTFGLSDEFPAVNAINDEWTAEDTFKRFTQIRAELPDEVPVFKPYEPYAKNEVYVAKNGRDSNPGTKEKPLKSFEAAFSKAASLKHKGSVVIYIREGIYTLDKTLEIPSWLSGSEKSPVIISAYPGESVKITGGINLSGADFKVADDAVAMRKLPKTAQGKVYSVDLKALGYTEYPEITQSAAPKLAVDGTEYTIARWPNSGTVGMANYDGPDGINGVFDPGPVTSELGGLALTGDDGRGFEFMVADNRPFKWENTDDLWMYGAFHVEYSTFYQHIRTLNADKKSIRTYTHERNGARYHPHNQHYYLNIMEELDIPGEWYLDKATGMLYIYPVSDLKDSSIAISGDIGNTISFEEGCEYIVINDITISDTTGYGVYLRGYRNLVQNCNVSNTAKGSIQMEFGKNCGVLNCVLYGNLRIANNLNSNSSNNDAVDLRPTRNFAQNNYVIGGTLSVRSGVQNIISHNTVINAQTMCIYIAECQENIIEYNEVVGGPWLTLDSGYIYHEGGITNAHNHIRYNYVHDATEPIRAAPYGIYLDDLSSNAFAYGNVVHEGYIFMHGGSNNVAYNNLIIDETSGTSVKNSDNYAGGGMHGAFTMNYLKYGAEQMRFNDSGFFKAGTNVWMNRYPTIYDWVQNLNIVRKDYINSDNYTISEFESKWIAPKDNVYMNNILYNSQDVGGNTKRETGSLWKDNYMVPEGVELFEDYDNKNYNIKNYAPVLSNVPGFEKLSPLESKGVTAMAKELRQPEIYPMFPQNTLEDGIDTTGITFKWTSSPVATFYEFELAEDGNFENVLVKAVSKSNTYAYDGEFDFDKQYFWRVKAVCYTNRVQNSVVDMKISTFRTYNYDEAVANTVINLDAYKSTCTDILNTLENFHEDTGVDIGTAVLKAGTKDEVKNLLSESEKRINTCKLQKEVEEETAKLYSEFVRLLNDRRSDSVRTYSPSDLSMWTIDSSRGSISSENDTATVKSVQSSVIAYDNRMLLPGEPVKLKMNFGNNSNWDAFAVKQMELQGIYSVVQGKGYYIIVKQDLIELQRYPVVGKEIIASVENGGRIKPNTWHDIEVSATPVENGQHIIFKVDGKTVIDHVDTDAPMNDPGYFSIQAFSTGIHFKDN